MRFAAFFCVAVWSASPRRSDTIMRREDKIAVEVDVGNTAHQNAGRYAAAPEIHQPGHQTVVLDVTGTAEIENSGLIQLQQAPLVNSTSENSTESNTSAHRASANVPHGWVVMKFKKAHTFSEGDPVEQAESGARGVVRTSVYEEREVEVNVTTEIAFDPSKGSVKIDGANCGSPSRVTSRDSGETLHGEEEKTGGTSIAGALFGAVTSVSAGVQKVSDFRRGPGVVLSSGAAMMGAGGSCAEKWLFVGHLEEHEDDYAYWPNGCGADAMAGHGLDAEFTTCFPASAQVNTVAGLKSVEHIRRSDAVVSFDTSGRLYEDIYLLDLHSGPVQRTVEAVFLEVKHSAQERPLRISPNHLLFVVGKSYPVQAKSVRKGDQLLVLRNEELVPSEVVTVSKVVDAGIYAPLTWSGRLVVDGVAVSSLAVHSQALEEARLRHLALQQWTEAVAHVLMLPLKIAHLLNWSPWCQSASSSTNEYAAFLRRVVDMVLPLSS